MYRWSWFWTGQRGGCFGCVFGLQGLFARHGGKGGGLAFRPVSFKTWRNGELLIHDHALPYPAREGISFTVKALQGIGSAPGIYDGAFDVGVGFALGAVVDADVEAVGAAPEHDGFLERV